MSIFPKVPAFYWCNPTRALYTEPIPRTADAGADALRLSDSTRENIESPQGLKRNSKSNYVWSGIGGRSRPHILNSSRTHQYYATTSSIWDTPRCINIHRMVRSSMIRSRLKLLGEQESAHSNIGKLYNIQGAMTPFMNGKRTVVGSGMDAQHVVSCLRDHGCRDITQEIDFSTMTNFMIRRGGFGQVYQARKYDGSKVAVKALIQVVDSMGGTSSKYQKRAGREGYSWSKCNHPNILPLLGVARYYDQIVMVSPWVDHGGLSDYFLLYPEADRCSLACQVAEGLAYMHSIGAIHGDIKGPNILVSPDGTAMLTDFGSTVLKHYTLQFTPTGTAGWSARWAAPEILAGEVLCSMEGDVWALGMTILEIITGKPPYSELERDIAVIAKIISQQLPKRQVLPNGPFGDRLWTLLTSCWESEPSRRPTAAYVRDCLKAIAANEEHTA